VQVAFYDPGADGQPGARGNMTYDIWPKAGARDFDDTSWDVIDPVTLSRPRGHGHLGFNWYWVRLTVPERVAGIDTAGTTVVFETQVDDYAEVWVDGELPHPTGVAGGPVVMGWNAKNRLVIGRDVKPGQQIQLAVFGINGPISKSPTNFIFLHYAKLEFHRGTRGPMGVQPHEVNLEVMRMDPAIDRIVPTNPKLWKLAGGFKFTEGPVWVPDGEYLLFSDPNSNTIYRWKDGELGVFRRPSGYAGADVAEYGATRLERFDAGPAEPAHHQRAWQSSRLPARARRQSNGAGRFVPGQAAEQPQRAGLQVGRSRVLHRSALRPAAVLRRSAQGAALQRRVPLEGR
jgi:gluconolactonase